MERILCDQSVSLLVHVSGHSVNQRLVGAIATSLEVLVYEEAGLQSIHNRHIDVE